MRLYTIGFTKKPARRFFELLRDAQVKRVVDVRRHNVSQLAGFAKRDDLAFFLDAIGGMDYVHLPVLAPTQDMLDVYRKGGGDWSVYEASFNALLRDRRIEAAVPQPLLADGCLLCSEHEPDHCHRRLVAEYLRDQWGEVDIIHLM